ncbi:MAG: hypothetical protein NZ955_05365 [Candidatus Bathyarchaeota archaeon]|nr:hypothetical protein [Candidatus Bathyarchaeota archaeon]MCX8162520.1 hypothetical protein [Candidatus Bathyarchaeota archaeon]
MNPFRIAELAVILAVSTLIISITYSSYILLNSLASLTSIKPAMRNGYILLEGFNLRNNGLYSVSIAISVDILQDGIELARYNGGVRLKPGESIKNLTLKLEGDIHIPSSIIDGFIGSKRVTAKTMIKIFIEPLISVKLEINETLEGLIL